MTFAAIEARTTAAAFRRLVNAQCAFPGALSGGVVFDAAGLIEDGVQTTQPSFLMQHSVAPLTAEGDDLVINAPELNLVSAAFRVRSVVPIAEGGMQRVTLAKV